MPIHSVSNLKKFRSGELSMIMKKFNVKGLSKTKQEKINNIRDHEQWENIKRSISIPKRAPRKFSPAQIAAQKAFVNKNRKGANKKNSKFMKVPSKRMNVPSNKNSKFMKVPSKRMNVPSNKNKNEDLKQLLSIFSTDNKIKAKIMKMKPAQHKRSIDRIGGLVGILNMDQLFKLL